MLGSWLGCSVVVDGSRRNRIAARGGEEVCLAGVLLAARPERLMQLSRLWYPGWAVLGRCGSSFD